VVLAITAAVVGVHVYHKLTNNTVIAYFPQALALYPGDKVQIMGVRVGAIDSIEPRADKMKGDLPLPKTSTRCRPTRRRPSSTEPGRVTSRPASPPTTVAVLENNAVIHRPTQVPVEWTICANQLTHLVTELGPTPEQPMGPFATSSNPSPRSGGQGPTDQHER